MLQKSKIRDLTVYDVSFYFFTKIFAIIEIQNHLSVIALFHVICILHFKHSLIWKSFEYIL